MNVKNRRRSYLAHVANARILGSVFVMAGSLMLILSAFLGTVYVLSQSGNFDFNAALTSIIESQRSDTTDGAAVQEVIGTSSDSGLVVLLIRQLLETELVDILFVVSRGFLVLWLGFMLRVSAILVETQLVDLSEI